MPIKSKYNLGKTAYFAIFAFLVLETSLLCIRMPEPKSTGKTSSKSDANSISFALLQHHAYLEEWAEIVLLTYHVNTGKMIAVLGKLKTISAFSDSRFHMISHNNPVDFKWYSYSIRHVLLNKESSK